MNVKLNEFSTRVLTWDREEMLAICPPTESQRSYQKVCALLVPTEERIWFPCDPVPMPAAGYVLRCQMKRGDCQIPRSQGHNRSLVVCGLLTCFSCSSELTLTLQISQWKVRSWVLGSDGSPPASEGSLGPRRGYALMGPSPLRASRMVLCLVPGKPRETINFTLWKSLQVLFLPPGVSKSPFLCLQLQTQTSKEASDDSVLTLTLILHNASVF